MKCCLTFVFIDALRGWIIGFRFNVLGAMNRAPTEEEDTIMNLCSSVKSVVENIREGRREKHKVYVQISVLSVLSVRMRQKSL